MIKRATGRIARPDPRSRPGPPPADVFRAFVRNLERLDGVQRRPSDAGPSGGEGGR